MSFEPTAEQAAIVLAVKTTPDNLIISALAGAAKTSTLVLLAKALPLTPTLCCAFNKRIADEMAKRMPGHITCKTMNSLGNAAWKTKTGKFPKVNPGKMYDILSETMNKLPPEEKKAFGEIFASVLRATRLCKSAGYVPDLYREFGETLFSSDEMLDALAPQLDNNPDAYLMSLVDDALNTSIAQAFQGIIDYDDQLYMSTLFGGVFAKYPIIMVDEAQDLSPLNHLMVKKMLAGRLIAVGDPFQAIYGFRGAHATSMDWLRREFKMTELSLSVSFRCPKNVVTLARARAPNMQYPEWAVDGTVQTLYEWEYADIPNDAAVICRNNAPLFKFALHMLRAGRPVKLYGSDLEKSLVKLLRKMGDGNAKQKEVLLAIDDWQAAEEAKARESRKAAISDRAECLRVFAEFGETLSAAVAYAEAIFAADGTIHCMTGHKSKGLEFDTVFHLNSWMIPSKFARRSAEDGDETQLSQELNLRYVITTRAKKNLFFINMDEGQ